MVRILSVDKLLQSCFQFFDFCPVWSEDVEENNETYREQKLFEQSVHVQDVLIKVNLRLGFIAKGEKANQFYSKKVPNSNIFFGKLMF